MNKVFRCVVRGIEENRLPFVFQVVIEGRANRSAGIGDGRLYLVLTRK